MAINPKTTREHILSLYGHVTGLKKELNQIKTNHLKHIHEDVEKLGGKVDKIYWVLLTVAGTAVLFMLQNKNHATFKTFYSFRDDPFNDCPT